MAEHWNWMSFDAHQYPMWQELVFVLSYESCSYEHVSSLYHSCVANQNSIPLLLNLKRQFSVFNDVFISVVKIANTSDC